MKTAMINTLKKINRTVLEMVLGILFLGILAQIIGAVIVSIVAADEILYAKSLWFGILLALAATLHIYRSLDRALDQPEKTANKMIFRAYVLRYVMVIFFLVVIMITEVMNPFVFFFTYIISLKVTAFLQPITHKLCNKMFHETDPEPHAPAEDAADNGEIPENADVVHAEEGTEGGTEE